VDGNADPLVFFCGISKMDKLCKELQKFHEDHFDLMSKSKGSKKKHQNWIGGYLDHISQCFDIAEKIYKTLNLKEFFELDSALKVLYFHDVEKIWKYTTGLPENFNKDEYLYVELAHKYNIIFTDDEKNALKYVHGEGDDYCSERVMNELAAFCHAVDIMSARIFYDEKKIR